MGVKRGAIFAYLFVTVAMMLVMMHLENVICELAVSGLDRVLFGHDQRAVSVFWAHPYKNGVTIASIERLFFRQIEI